MSRKQLRQLATLPSLLGQTSLSTSASARWMPTSSWAGSGSPISISRPVPAGPRFASPVPTACVAATPAFSAGAAEVAVLGLGNSRCEEIEFEGGMGKVLLDFSGVWSSSAHVEVKMAVGGHHPAAARRVGVRLAMDKFLSSFEPAGWLRRGDSFVSSNYDSAERRLDFDLTTAVGGGQRSNGYESERQRLLSHSHLTLLNVPPRDPGLRPRHLVRFWAECLRHGGRRRV